MLMLPYVFLVSTYLIVFLSYFQPYPRSRVAQRSALLSLNVSVFAALAQNLIPLSGVLVAVILITCAWFSRHSSRPLAIASKVLMGVLALVVSLKLFGWQKLVLNPSLDLGNPPFEWALNFDKPFAGAVLAIALLMLAPPTRTRSLSVQNVVWILIGIFILVLATYLLGGNPAPKWTMAVTLFLVTNLIFAVIPEELFFRSLIQSHFPRGTPLKDAGTTFALTGLFTIAHYSPKIDPTYLILVAIAGTIYAYTYQITRSIFWAFTIHLTVNLLSVVLFDYPIRLG